MADIPAFEDIKLPTDADFEDFRISCTEEDVAWSEVYKDEKYHVWTRKAENSAINIARAKTQFFDVEAATLYDVLHDHEYRTGWDENMIEGYVIELLNKHTEVGYYSAKMPTTITNRDFCNLRTWRVDEERGEYIIFNFSVRHEKCPEKKGFVRARSIRTGYMIRKLDNGCEFIYYSQSDPKGWIPTWVINYLMTKLPPRLLDKLHSVALAYSDWKSKHEPEHKPWLNTVEEGEEKKSKKKKKHHEEESAPE